ncbi:MAG: glycosyltransferase, partial [Nocardioidaceae bacterium]
MTAVIVTHDGARWLPRLLESLERQSRLPDQLVAVDTGSADETPDLLERSLGTESVLTVERTVGFGAAISHGLHHLNGQAPPAGADHWIWVLHDDMQLDPHTLQELLATAGEDPELSVVGPKVRDWPRRMRLLEMGLTVTGTARRMTGVEMGEYDQGQHDTDVRDTLAVGSAGMLVRKSAWEELGGFDPALKLFGDDLDLGWRAARAGLRTAVSPDAVVFHAEAGARGQRALDAARGNPHRLAREHALYTVLANCRGWAVPLVAVRLLLGSLLRALGMLLVKAPGLAADELVAVASALGRPGRLWSGRRRRRSTARLSHSKVRPLLASWWAPYGHGLDLVGQVVAEIIDALADRTRGANRGVETGPVSEEAQNLQVELGPLGWLLSRPLGIAVTALVLLSLLSAVDVFGAGLLQGGALLPSPPGAGDWWGTYVESWHPVSVGSDVAAPPYVVVLGFLGTLLLGKAWLVVTLLFGFAVPLTTLAGYVLARRLVGSRLIALWAAVAYGLLPVLTGAVGQGRLGTVVAAVLLPLQVRCAVAAVDGRSVERRWRAAFGAGLLLTVIAAFVPLALPAALVVGVGYWLLADRHGDLLLRVVAVLSVPVLALLPWLLHLGADPAGWVLAEAGYEAGVAGQTWAAPWQLALGRPGGPGQAPAWLTVGLVLAAVAALLRNDRRRVVLTAWGVGLAGLALAALPQGDGAWPGFAVLLAQGAAVVAAAAAGDGAVHRLGDAAFGWRQPVAAVITVAALLAPVLGAGWWILGQDPGLLRRAGPLQVPAFMADAQQSPRSVRTLVISGGSGGSAGEPRVAVHLARGPGLFVGQDDVAPDPPTALVDLAARLITEPSADDVSALAGHGVGHVLLSTGDEDQIAAVDGAPGLVRASAGELDAAAWQLDAPSGPVRVTPQRGDPTAASVLPISSGSVDVSVPAGEGRRLLTLGERTDDGWQAELAGRELEPRVVDGWNQAFVLPGQGGELVVEHSSSARVL